MPDEPGASESNSARPYPAVYALSKRYGPPRINLRDAEVLDAYGDDLISGPAVSHTVPEDVTMDELSVYGMFGFLGFEDLLFYLYPVALAIAHDRRFAGNSFFDALNGFSHRLRRLPLSDQDAVREGLTWMGLLTVSEGHAGTTPYTRLRRFVESVR